MTQAQQPKNSVVDASPIGMRFIGVILLYLNRVSSWSKIKRPVIRKMLSLQFIPLVNVRIAALDDGGME